MHPSITLSEDDEGHRSTSRLSHKLFLRMTRLSLSRPPHLGSLYLRRPSNRGCGPSRSRPFTYLLADRQTDPLLAPAEYLAYFNECMVTYLLQDYLEENSLIHLAYFDECIQLTYLFQDYSEDNSRKRNGISVWKTQETNYKR